MLHSEDSAPGIEKKLAWLLPSPYYVTGQTNERWTNPTCLPTDLPHASLFTF